MTNILCDLQRCVALQVDLLPLSATWRGASTGSRRLTLDAPNFGATGNRTAHAPILNVEEIPQPSELVAASAYILPASALICKLGRKPSSIYCVSYSEDKFFVNL